jgi:putative oxidoreductase
VRLKHDEVMTSTSTRNTKVKSLQASAIALGAFRMLVGLLFMTHGTAKLFGWPAGSPAALGAWPMWWAGALEVVLGGLIALGLFTRAAAFVASGMMAVAYFWMHFPDSFWPSINGGETAVLYCFVFLLLTFIGPGALAVSRR